MIHEKSNLIIELCGQPASSVVLHSHVHAYIATILLFMCLCTHKGTNGTEGPPGVDGISIKGIKGEKGNSGGRGPPGRVQGTYLPFWCH